eukprot:TRINITY_DN63528_c0_g1_i1.p1 TRINITY_DN63528_c0_g1~~TRINITY_DN63528_c0_g1_i1.p1  ORF type:complete len:653 (-),score=103.63 TRINITY_DN63528_c0_g1_i1:128-2086(-)
MARNPLLRFRGLAVRRRFRVLVSQVINHGDHQFSKMATLYAEGIDKMLLRLDRVIDLVAWHATYFLIPLYAGSAALLLLAFSSVAQFLERLFHAVVAHRSLFALLFLIVLIVAIVSSQLLKRAKSSPDQPLQDVKRELDDSDNIDDSQETAHESPLAKRIRDNQLDLVKEMLSTSELRTLCKVWLHRKDETGLTPLMYSMFLADGTIFWNLINLGSPLQAVDSRDYSIITYAALCQRTTVFQWLLRNGVVLRDSDWANIAEVAMELEPLKKLPEGVRDMKAAMHHGLLRSPACRARKARSFLTRAKLRQIICVGDLPIRTRWRLLRHAADLRFAGVPEVLAWLADGCVDNCHASGEELFPESVRWMRRVPESAETVSVAAAVGEAVARTAASMAPPGAAAGQAPMRGPCDRKLRDLMLDAEPPDFGSPMMVRRRFATEQSKDASFPASQPPVNRLEYEVAEVSGVRELRGRVAASSPGERILVRRARAGPAARQAHHLQVSEVRSMYATAPELRRFSVVWRAAAVDAQSKLATVAHVTAAALELYAALVRAGSLSGSCWLTSSKLEALNGWAEATPGRLLLLIEGAEETEFTDEGMGAWKLLERLLTACVVVYFCQESAAKKLERDHHPECDGSLTAFLQAPGSTPMANGSG